MTDLFAQSFPSRVSCYLQAVSAQLHATPAPRPFLARVVEVQHALPALSHAISVYLGDERGHAVGQWCKQVFGLMRFKPEFGGGLFFRT